MAYSADSKSIPDWLPFANRDDECKKVFRKPVFRKFLFEGPPGSGKTALLHRLEAIAKDQDDPLNPVNMAWYGAHIQISDGDEWFYDFIQNMQEALEESWEYDKTDYEGCGDTVGFRLALSAKRRKSQGLYMLFDLMHDVRPGNDIVEVLSEAFVPAMVQALEREAPEFGVTRPYTIAITCRSLRRTTRDRLSPRKTGWSLQKLEPLDYSVTVDICHQLHKEIGAIGVDAVGFAADLYFYSMGYPNLMKRILTAFTDSRQSPRQFFMLQQDNLRKIVREEAETVRSHIPEHFRQQMDTLSLFRRYDRDIIRHYLVNRRHGSSSNVASTLSSLELGSQVFDLQDEMKYEGLAESLINKANVFEARLHRKLLAANISFRATDTFQRLAIDAVDFTKRGINHGTEHHHIENAVEYVHQFLQQGMLQAHDPAVRKERYDQFFAKVIPETVELLSEGRDRRAVLRDFREELDGDAEMQFLINYYLREDIYNEDPFEKLFRYLGKMIP